MFVIYKFIVTLLRNKAFNFQIYKKVGLVSGLLEIQCCSSPLAREIKSYDSHL